MTARYAVRDAILTYLRVANEPRSVLIIARYMQRMHKIERGAVRTQLWRLCQAGLVERVGVGEYRVAPGGSR